MRVLLRAAVGTAALSLLVAASGLAKGEDVNVTIGPIDDMGAGTPTPVTAQVTVSGQATTDPVGAYLSFFEPISGDQLEFSLNYDRAAGAYVALVTLPHEGRWLVDAGTRHGTGSAIPYGGSDGTHVVTVRAAPPAAPAFPSAPFLAGAAVASAAWLLGIGASMLRRRRRVATTGPSAPLGEGIPV